MIHGTVAGNLGKDAELRHTQNGKVVCSFSVASNKKDKDGEDVTTWVRCSLWGVRGEKLAKYLTSGTRVTVVGSLELRSYDKDGETRTSLECDVADVALMGGKAAGETAAPRQGGQRAPAPPPADDFGGDGEIPF